MVGGGGSYQILRYGSLTDVPELSNADTSGASAFYSRRLSRSQYLGADYSYGRFSTDPIESTTNTNAILVFYTVYPRQGASLSILAGPQHYTAEQAPYASKSAWTPAVLASAGWQTSRANMIASYARAVSGGAGLVGAYYSNTALASVRWLMTRSWNIGMDGGYSNLRNATSIPDVSNQGGHTWSASASIRRRISENLHGELGYGHFYQSYAAIQSVSNFPDSNRVYVSINYQFTRPLGR